MAGLRFDWFLGGSTRRGRRFNSRRSKSKKIEKSKKKSKKSKKSKIQKKSKRNIRVKHGDERNSAMKEVTTPEREMLIVIKITITMLTISSEIFFIYSNSICRT